MDFLFWIEKVQDIQLLAYFMIAYVLTLRSNLKGLVNISTWELGDRQQIFLRCEVFFSSRLVSKTSPNLAKIAKDLKKSNRTHSTAAEANLSDTRSKSKVSLMEVEAADAFGKGGDGL